MFVNGEVDELLKLVVDKGATDLHLKVPSPPVFRIDGALIPQEDWPSLAAKDIEVIFEQITTQEQRIVFSNHSKNKKSAFNIIFTK